MLHKSYVPLFWLFVPFYWPLSLIMGINADLNGLVSIRNKYWGIVGFNVLLHVDPSITLLLVSQVSYYLCYLCEALLMLTTHVHVGATTRNESFRVPPKSVVSVPYNGQPPIAVMLNPLFMKVWVQGLWHKGEKGISSVWLELSQF